MKGKRKGNWRKRGEDEEGIRGLFVEMRERQGEERMRGRGCCRGCCKERRSRRGTVGLAVVDECESAEIVLWVG